LGPAPSTANVGMIARITWPAGRIPKHRLEHTVAWEEE
jgi:hypothetical protein